MHRAVLFGLTLAAVALVAGCELEPGTGRPPPAVAAPDTGSAAAATGSAAAPAEGSAGAPAEQHPGAGSAVPPGTPASCVTAASHLADLQQLAPEQRDQYVRGTSMGCGRMAWSPQVIDCILQAQTTAALQPCSELLRKELEAKNPAGGAPHEPPAPPTPSRAPSP